MSDTRLLVIDIGNTNVSLGVFDYPDEEPAKLAHHWRISTNREQTSDELGIMLRSLFQQEGISTESVSDLIVSSVVPPLQPIWERVSTKLFDRPPLLVVFQQATIAVDFGTATTFDCISKDGEYMGGAIFPGIHIAMDALFARTSKLHRVELARPRSVIGKTTTGALQSGLLYGYAGLVDSMVERIRPELGGDVRVLATGGLAARIANETKSIERVEPFLTLTGLRLLFEKNRSDGSRKER
jgi:type III pantothenate kinase